MTAPVTGLYAGLLVLFVLVLGVRITYLRSRLRVGSGHGNDPLLARAIRVHGNAFEWIVPMLLVLLVAELDGANRTFLHLCGITFTAARFAHAYGLSRTTKSSPGRFWGMAGTWLVIVVLALWDISAMLQLGWRMLTR